jgi:hypothetical protein
MNTKLINKLEKMIIVPKGDLKEIIDNIEYLDVPLSDPKRKDQREKYYIVLNHLYLHHFHHKNQAKGSYAKGGAKYLPKELSSDNMRSKVGQIWDEISKTLQDNHIIENNGDFDSDKEKNPKKLGKKTTKSFCGNARNHLGRPFAMCYRLAPTWQSDNYWDLKEVSVPNKLDPPRIRDEEGNLHLSNITINVSTALIELKKLAKERGWSPVIQKIYGRKIVLFNHTIFEDKECSTGRVFNKVNCLPSALREHLLIKGIPMKELDIKSCLPNILYFYITDTEEQKKWLDHIKNKRLYKFFAAQCGFYSKEEYSKCRGQEEIDLFIEAGEKKAKNAVCCYLGGKRKQDSKKVDDVIRNRFPILHEAINKIESSSKHKGELSRKLQRIESKIAVVGMGDQPYTTISIHDGVGVATNHLEKAYYAIHQLFEEYVGCPCIITGFEPEKQKV